MLSSRPARHEDVLSRPRGHSLSRQLSPKKHKAAAPFAFWFPGLSADRVTLAPGLQGPTLSRGEPSVLSDPKDPGCFLAELIRGVHQCPPLRPRHTSSDGWKVLCGGRRPAWALPVRRLSKVNSPLVQTDPISPALSVYVCERPELKMLILVPCISRPFGSQLWGQTSHGLGLHSDSHLHPRPLGPRNGAGRSTLRGGA